MKTKEINQLINNLKNLPKELLFLECLFYDCAKKEVDVKRLRSFFVMNLQRYSFYHQWHTIPIKYHLDGTPDEKGDYVSYYDAKEEIERLEKEIDRLKSEKKND